MGRTVVVCAGQYALVPEAVDFSARRKSVEGRSHSRLCRHFIPPGSPQNLQQQPDKRRHHSQHQSLKRAVACRSSCLALPGHKMDCTGDGARACSHFWDGWRCEGKSGQTRRSPKAVAAPQVRTTTNVWPDFPCNPKGRGPFSPSLRHSSLRYARYLSLLAS